VVYFEEPYAAMAGADALVIATEWDEFRALDLERVTDLLRTPVLVDLRNIYPRAAVEQIGLAYTAVGR
jgi:UDPglucose 6-dehydrogenase